MKNESALVTKALLRGIPAYRIHGMGALSHTNQVERGPGMSEPYLKPTTS